MVAAADALARAGVAEGDAGYAIFGQTANAATPLRDGDRVEFTRPLVADLKAVRRKLAKDPPIAPSPGRREHERDV